MQAVNFAGIFVAFVAYGMGMWALGYWQAGGFNAPKRNR